MSASTPDDKPTSGSLGRRIFVAGDSGLVGAALVRALLDADPSTTVVGASRGEGRVDDSRYRHIRADLTRREECRAAIDGCDRIVIAAARTGGAAEARAEPWRQVTDNVVMESLLLEAAHLARVRRVVLIGSATVYQNFEGAIREDQLDWNIDPHPSHLGVGWAKRYMEKQGRFWHEATGMEVVAVRAANVYGPWAKFDPSASNVVAALIRKAADRMDPYEIWGDPEATRDIIHTDDFARAIVCLLARTDIVHDVFNVGGDTVSVAEIAGHALNAAGHDPKEIRRIGDGPATIRRRALDCSKITRAIGWKPVISPADGIRRTYEWWQRNKETWKR